MSIFDKQIVLFEGKGKATFQGYQSILRSHNIRFKAYATDDQLKYGCCGLNSGAGSKISRFTYTIFVKAKDAEAAKAWIGKIEPLTEEGESIKAIDNND